jgi:DNA-binding transcriptional LysR family regulator
VLKRYLATHPDVNIDLQEKLSNEIVRAVMDGKTDIGIVAGSVRTENLQTLPYRSDSLVLVVSEHHPVADLPSVQLIDALEFDHVGLHEASALHAFLNRECEQLNKPLKVRIQVSSFESACRMIEAGVGVGVLPESAARRHARSMAIRLVPLSDAWAIRSMQICVRNFDELPNFARDLIDLLAEDARQAMS